VARNRPVVGNPKGLITSRLTIIILQLVESILFIVLSISDFACGHFHFCVANA